jgi:monoamine oxidase
MTDTRTALDRRTLLKAAGASAVAAALPRTLRAQNKSEVLVIGAGLSGLNAALLLEEAGVDVRVIEGRDRVGGRVLSHRNVPGNPESGGTGFGPGYARLVSAARNYGVELIDITPTIPFFFKRELALGGEIIPMSAWPAHPRNPFPAGAKETPPWMFLPGFLARNNPLKSVEDWLSPRSAKFDVSLHQWLAENGISEEVIELAYNMSPSHGNTAYDVSALMVLFAAMFAELQRQLGGRIAGYTAKGGNMAIPEAMGKALKTEIQFRKDVTGIRSSDDGAEVHCADGSVYKADYVICSIPFSVLRRIPIEPMVTGAQGLAIRTLESQAISLLHIVPKKPFWEQDGLNPSMSTDGLPGMVLAEHKGANPADVTSLSVWVRGHQATRLDELEQKDAAAAVVRAIEKLRPAAKGQLEVRAFKSWSRDPFSGGDWAVWQPGQVNAFARAVGQPHGRIHFCGEHTAQANRGMEGAMESGERVAIELLDYL